MSSNKKAISRIFQSRIFLATLLIITLVSGFRLLNELSRRGKINSEISHLQNEIETLQKEQSSLESLIKHLNSDSYIEEQARKKLSLKKPGETVVVISDSSSSVENKNSPESYAMMWLKYFFGNS